MILTAAYPNGYQCPGPGTIQSSLVGPSYAVPTQASQTSLPDVLTWSSLRPALMATSVLARAPFSPRC